MSIYYSGIYGGLVSTNSIGGINEPGAVIIKKNIFGKNVQKNFFILWGIIAESLDGWDSELNVLKNRLHMEQPFDFYVLFNSLPNKIVIAFSSQKATRGNCNLLFDEAVLSSEVDTILKKRAKILSGIEYSKWISIPVEFVKEFSAELDEKLGVNQDIDTTADLRKLGESIWHKTLQLNHSQDKNIFKFKKEEVETMDFNPIFKARDLTVDNKLAFGILQFDSKRSAFFDDLIKPVIEKEFQINVVKSGDMFDANNSNIMENIWTSINTSKFIICDLSGKNPNVFYELGIANTIGKPVITICDEDSFKKDYDGKLPFDVSTTNTIFYSDTAVGAKKFESKLKATVKSIITGQPISGNFY